MLGENSEWVVDCMLGRAEVSGEIAEGTIPDQCRCVPNGSGGVWWGAMDALMPKFGIEFAPV